MPIDTADKHYTAMLEELHWHVKTFFRYENIDSGRAARAKAMLRDIMEEITLLQQYGEGDV